MVKSLSFVLGFVVLIAGHANGQSVANATIRGRVTDATGGALPGVSVAATSPALITPQVAVVTDAAGEYALPDLPIGLYRVSYDLTGFQRFVRDGIQLTAGFTATINVVMRIGSVEESITVSGQSPIVDMTSATPRVSLPATFITDVLPVTRNVQEYMATAPGVVPSARADLGGGLNSGGQYSAYGLGSQATYLIDGVDTRQGAGGSQQQGIGPDFASMEELQVVPVAGAAEQALPGLLLNMIVKSGGNQYHGRYEVQGQDDSLQSSNLTPELIAEGVNVGDTILNSFESSGDLGGRFIKDKLWFYGALRYQHAERTVLGFSLSPGPDGRYQTADDVPGTKLSHLHNETIKLTEQAGRAYRLIGLYTYNGENFNIFNANRNLPWEATQPLRFYPQQAKAELQATPSGRLLFNLLLGMQKANSSTQPVPNRAANGAPSALDNATLLNTGPVLGFRTRPRISVEPVGSVSYFPSRELGGKHELKAGFKFYWQQQQSKWMEGLHGNYKLIFDTVGGIAHQPFQIQTVNYPVNPVQRLNEGGLYVQDAWRPTARLTMNVGIRYDSFHTWLPAQSKEVSQFSTAGSFPELETGTWRQWAPRISAAWDLFGTGKTVLKSTLGRYNHTPGDEFNEVYNRNGVVTTTYRWRDLNGNGDYDPGEVDLNTNGPDFVSIASGTTTLVNPDLRNPYTTQFTVGVDRELMPNFAGRFNYIYLSQTDLSSTINVLRPYNIYEALAPRQDPGPDGTLGTTDDGGNIVLYDYPAAYRGSAFVSNMRVNGDAAHRPVFKTYEVVLTRRATGRWGLLGSASATKNHRYLTVVPSSPNDDYFNVDDTWDWQAKITGNYEFPLKVTLSGSFQAYSPVKGQRTNLFRNIPSLSTATIRMEPFGETQGSARTLLNLRFSRTFAVRTTGRLKVGFDLMNALNGASPWMQSYASGPTFANILQIDSPRIARGSLTFSF